MNNEIRGGRGYFERKSIQGNQNVGAFLLKYLGFQGTMNDFPAQRESPNSLRQND
jgi:hypothetical protein